MSINTEMTALADAIRNKSGATGKLSISNMTVAVNDISVGSDTDLSFVTASAGDILSGKVGSDSDGNQVYGSIPTVSASSDGEYVTVPAGFHASEQKLPIIISGSGGSVDLSFVTAGDLHILEGYVGADKEGNPVYGTCPGFLDTIVQVKAYHLAQPACTGLSKIVVSGLGPGYTSANGTYEVTKETERIAKPFDRIYKHTYEEWYIWGYEEYEDEGCWYIGPAPDSGSLSCYTSGALTDGTYEFEDFDSGYYGEVDINSTATEYEASDARIVVDGVGKDEYLHVENVNKYEVVPQVGRCYRYSNTQNKLFGRATDIGNGMDGIGLICLSRWGRHVQDDGKLIDLTGVCEIKQMPYTDRYIDVWQVPSPFGTPLLNFLDLGYDQEHITIKKLPKTKEFTIEYWEFYLQADNTANWGGTVLLNKTCWEKSGNEKASTILSADTTRSNAIVREWFHHAFVYNGNGGDVFNNFVPIVFEYVNGVKIAEHKYYGDVFYDEERETVAYKEGDDIFGDDEYAFHPGWTGNYYGKYVAQLAIWNLALAEDDFKEIIKYKHPYDL